MTNIKTQHGLKIILNRATKAIPDYSPPSLFTIGQDEGAITNATTNLQNPLPILDGTVVFECDSAFTGSSGGTNTTDNTVIFKPGANTTDNTAQNLIPNDTNTEKIWTKSGLTFTDDYFGCNIYIDDVDTLAIFDTLELRFKDSGGAADEYYSKTYNNTDLSTAWNWLYIEKISDLTTGAGGAPSVVNTIIIIITTPVATDIWTEGKIIIDLIRQWEDSDIYKSFYTGYPMLDEINMTATYQMKLYSTEAVGFSINVLGLINSIASPILTDIHLILPDGKSDTEEIIYQIIDEYKQEV
jgi:hypothetical protein